jgi:predicted phosphate transport protein (TIGR00153 family)
MFTEIIRKLFPHKEQFFDLLDKSAVNLSDGIHSLETLARLEPGGERDAIVVKLEELEHAGDRVTHQIYTELGRTFITPIDAEDIHALASGLDDVMDRIEGISTRIRLYKIPALPSSFLDMISVLSKAIQVLNHIIPQLRDMHRERKTIVDGCRDVHQMEDEGDRIYHETIAALFSVDAGHNGLLESLKLKEVIMGLEWATDSCERLANHIEHVVLKYA